MTEDEFLAVCRPKQITDESVVLLRKERNTLTFRKAAQGEDETVCALYKSVLGSEFCAWDEEYPGIREARHDLETGNLYVLADGGAVVGALSVVPENELDGLTGWRYTGGGHRELARVVVAKGYRGRGLAGRMVREVEPLLRETGCTSLRLLAVKGHLPALKTYEKAGFRTVGEARAFGHDYFLMEKPLA